MCYDLYMGRYFDKGLSLLSLNTSLWNSSRIPLISDVISSFKEVIRLSKTLFSTLGDLALEGPTISTSCSIEFTIPTKTGKDKLSHTFSVFSC